MCYNLTKCRKNRIKCKLLYIRELFGIELKIAIVSAALLLALISDIRTYKIKNSITYSFMAMGLTINIISGGINGMLLSLHGMILPVLCLIILYMAKMIGAGDIKLFSALGSVMGAAFTLYAVVCSFICGGVIASLLILIRRNGKDRFRHLYVYIKSCLISMKPLQYADFSDKKDGSKFHFSIAAAFGTAVALFLNTSIL